MCTCPVSGGCKHVVAALLAANRLARGADAPSTPAAPWRSLLAAPSAEPGVPLALGIELRQRVRRGTSPWAPIRLETATARSLDRHGTDVMVGLRPLERSSRSLSWIKGTVSWDTLRRPGHRFAAEQARWFVELHSIGRDMRMIGGFADAGDWLTLDDIESALLWGHLAAASSLHIAIVPTVRHLDLDIARSAEVGIRLDRQDGGLRLSANGEIDGDPIEPSAVRPIGHSGVYRFTVRRERIALTLAEAPLADPLPALLRATESVIVPPDDAEEFVREHLPPMLRSVRVEARTCTSRCASHPRTDWTTRSAGHTPVARSAAWTPRPGPRTTRTPKPRSERASRGCGARIALSRSRRAGPSPVWRPPSSPHGCCPRSKGSPTSPSRSSAPGPGTASSPATRT
jgi:hypothetical protein